jgi:uncharacterized membrane protein YoaK (UPF0700 family)
LITLRDSAVSTADPFLAAIAAFSIYSEFAFPLFSFACAWTILGEIVAKKKNSAMIGHTVLINLLFVIFIVLLFELLKKSTEVIC